MRPLALLLFLSLAACAPKLSFANEAGGVIERTGGLRDEQTIPLAEAHCARFGKLARITGTDPINNTTRFECVAR